MRKLKKKISCKAGIAFALSLLFLLDFTSVQTMCAVTEERTNYNASASTQDNRSTLSENKIESIITDAEKNGKKDGSADDSKKIVDDFLNSSSSLNALDGKTEDEIYDYFANVQSASSSSDNTSGGLITNPITYLHNTVGKSTDTYTMTSSHVVSGTAGKTCSDLGGGNNCTLTALYNIMVYYKAQGYSKISTSTLYSTIKTQATNLGYTTSSGLSVTKNNNLVTNTWKALGYTSGSGSNNYLWTASTATNLINNDRPFMFSLASGKYYDHTVTVYGYYVYKNNRTGTKYTFLLLKDGWSSSTRYLAWTNTPESYTACLTSITPPSSK